MGMCPPQSYQDVFNAAMACDANGDGRYSKMEVYTLFLRIQGISSGATGVGVINLGGLGGFGGMGMGAMGMGGW